MTRRTVFLDLDGTLLDSRLRLYELFSKLVPGAAWTFESYWRLKYEGLKHREILARIGWTSAEIVSFEQVWHDEIENDALLQLDKPIPGVEAALNILREHFRLVVLTSRQREDGVRMQLGQLGWRDLFDEVWVTGRARSKLDLLRRAGDGGHLRGWMVGDTGHDIETGRTCGLATVAVLSGFMTEATLRGYAPDHLIEDVSRLPSLLIEHRQA